MAIISTASLKGGVGKTSLSLNLADAFRNKGYRVLVIDSDPAAHASRYFKDDTIAAALKDASLAKLFFSLRKEYRDQSEVDILEAIDSLETGLLVGVRENLYVLPGGPELHHFQWGQGSKLYQLLFPQLLSELEGVFDIVVIDTAPDFNVVTRSALACSNLVLVPVDSSEMSICSLEDLIVAASHLEKPHWAIVRTMVNTQASRIKELGDKRLQAGLNSDESADVFLQKVSELTQKSELPENTKPIYLLDSFTKRTEQQNRLSFLASTAFELKEASKLAAGYLDIASELELLLGLDEVSDFDSSEEEEEESFDDEEQFDDFELMDEVLGSKAAAVSGSRRSG